MYTFRQRSRPTIPGARSYRWQGGIQLAASLDIEAIFRRNAQAVYRVCYSFMRSAADAEDATQAAFMRLIDHPQEFADEGHERAWLITVASNICRDTLKSAAYARVDGLPEDAEVADARAGVEEEVVGKAADDEVLAAIMRLPEKYKDVVFLHYYEGRKTDEIARMLGSPPSTVRNWLREARGLLKRTLGEDER